MSLIAIASRDTAILALPVGWGGPDVRRDINVENVRRDAEKNQIKTVFFLKPPRGGRTGFECRTSVVFGPLISRPQTTVNDRSVVRTRNDIEKNGNAISLTGVLCEPETDVPQT